MKGSVIVKIVPGTYSALCLSSHSILTVPLFSLYNFIVEEIEAQMLKELPQITQVSRGGVWI